MKVFLNDLAYYSLDGFLKYTISTSGSLNPYIFGGYGFSSFDDGLDNKKGPFPSFDVSETPFGGVGFDISLSEKFSINLSSSYRYADELKSYKHFQHVVGLSFKPGTNDSDGDKIKDKKMNVLTRQDLKNMLVVLILTVMVLLIKMMNVQRKLVQLK